LLVALLMEIKEERRGIFIDNMEASEGSFWSGKDLVEGSVCSMCVVERRLNVMGGLYGM
jgi:hypothetical protein